MREGTTVGRTAGEVTSLEIQQVNSQVPEIAVYLCWYLRASFKRSGVNSLCVCSVLVLHEQTRIAATRFIWTAVILNSKIVDHFQT